MLKIRIYKKGRSFMYYRLGTPSKWRCTRTSKDWNQMARLEKIRETPNGSTLLPIVWREWYFMHGKSIHRSTKWLHPMHVDQWGVTTATLIRQFENDTDLSHRNVCQWIRTLLTHIRTGRFSAALDKNGTKASRSASFDASSCYNIWKALLMWIILRMAHLPVSRIGGSIRTAHL